MKSVSIVLLAQHENLVEGCLTALYNRTKQPYELIVVLESGATAIAKKVGTLKNVNTLVVLAPKGFGVAAGYNLGAAQARGEVVVFMRDTVAVGKDWLEPLVDCLEAHPEAAAAGPLSHGVSGAQHATGDVGELLELDRASREAVRADRRASRLIGLTIAIRSAALAQLGGFDERFEGESYEDDDLCYRALLAGYSLYIACGSFVAYNSPYLTTAEWHAFSDNMSKNKRVATAKWGSDLTELLQNWKLPATVSLCMIVKNEEETLDRCLSSVSDLVQEIIVVDTGSTDATKQVAARFGARIFDFEWVDDFAKARNYAFDQATQDYILWLDADDVLLPKDQAAFAELTAALPTQADAISMHYHLGKDEYGNVTSSLRRNRLVRRSMNFKWIGIVHEYLQVHGHIVHSEIAVTHDRVHGHSDRNLHIYERKQRSGETFNPRDIYYYANELYDHGLWERAAEQYEKLLAESEVWMEDRIGACGRAAECYHALGHTQLAKIKALQSFAYALPRAENCCRLGSFYLSEDNYKEAAWWYRLATEVEMPSDSSALLQHSCWTWLPRLQLCVCYDRMGEYALAYEENEQAAAYIPRDARIVANRSYLQSRLGRGEHAGGIS